MDSYSRVTSPTGPEIDPISLNRRIKSYKECCYRAYAFGLASISIVSSVSYFVLKKLPIRRNYVIMVSGCVGSVAGYVVSKDKSKECNLMLKAHRDSMRNPVQTDPRE